MPEGAAGILGVTAVHRGTPLRPRQRRALCFSPSNVTIEPSDFWLRESSLLESLDLKTTNDGESATSLGKLLQWLIILPV